MAMKVTRFFPFALLLLTATLCPPINAAGGAPGGSYNKLLARTSPISANSTVTFNHHTSEIGDVATTHSAVITVKAPHTWHIASTIKNNSPRGLRVLPMYLYSEYQPSPHLENASIISPVNYRANFSDGAKYHFRTPPSDLSGILNEQADVPQDFLDKPFTGEHLICSRLSLHLAASLAMNGSATGWKLTTLPPKGTLECTWDFWSNWAASYAVRTSKDFGSVLLGPIVLDGTQAFLGIAKLKMSDTPGEQGDANLDHSTPAVSRQSSFTLTRITPELAKDLLQAYPNSPSVEEFAGAAMQIAVMNNYQEERASVAAIQKAAMNNYQESI